MRRRTAQSACLRHVQKFKFCKHQCWADQLLNICPPNIWLVANLTDVVRDQSRRLLTQSVTIQINTFFALKSYNHGSLGSTMSLDIKPVQLTLPIAYRHLGEKEKAVKEKLNDLKSHYLPEADGVLIQWSDLNFLHDKGIIIDDQPYVFWRITFTAHVFKPIEGKLIKGKIKQMTRHYFIAQAMDSFAFVVTVPDILKDKLAEYLVLDQDVYFKIKASIDGDYRGEVDDECIPLIKSAYKPIDEDHVYDYAKDFEY